MIENTLEEAIEASYENIQAEAANACKNVRPLV